MVEGQLAQLAPSAGARRAAGGAGSGTAGGSSKQSVGQAFAELCQQAQQGRLPAGGAFHGRLCNIARVVQPQALASVNAVLMEACNLVSRGGEGACGCD